MKPKQKLKGCERLSVDMYTCVRLCVCVCVRVFVCVYFVCKYLYRYVWVWVFCYWRLVRKVFNERSVYSDYLYKKKENITIS